MGKTFKKIPKRKQAEPRSIETLTALLHCKGGPMRDRRDRRRSEEDRLAIQSSMEEDVDD